MKPSQARLNLFTISEAINQLEETDNVIGWSSDCRLGCEVTLHVSRETFLRLFGGEKAQQSDVYPNHVSIARDGVSYYAILKPSDVGMRYVPLTVPVVNAPELDRNQDPIGME